MVPCAAGSSSPREQGGHAHRAGALDDQLGALEQQHHRLGDHLLVHDDHAVDPLRDQRPGDLAGVLDRDAVGDRRADRRRSGGGAVERSRVRGARRGLDADDDGLGMRRLDRHRHAAGEPPAAEGHHDLAQVLDVLGELEPERALAGDHVEVVEGVHEGEVALLRALSRGGDAVVDRPVEAVHDRAERARGAALGDRRVGRHVDLAPHPPRPRGVRRRLGVVAGAAHHQPVANLVAERGQLGQHAAQLERAGALQALGLERDRAAAARAQRGGREDRRPAHEARSRRAGALEALAFDRCDGGPGHADMIALRRDRGKSRDYDRRLSSGQGGEGRRALRPAQVARSTRHDDRLTIQGRARDGAARRARAEVLGLHHLQPPGRVVGPVAAHRRGDLQGPQAARGARDGGRRTCFRAA